MKTAFALGAGFLVLAAIAPAKAADLPMPATAPILPAFSWSWTGVYLGNNVGYGWENQSFNLTAVNALGTATLSGSSNGSGWLLGGQVGFNYELPAHFVVGIEADGDWANISGSSSGCSTFTTGTHVGAVAGCGTNSAQIDDFGTVRGRIGYAWNNVLFYGTGGWAWGNSSGTHTTTCVSGFPPVCPGGSLTFTGGGASFSNSLSGWAAGVGVEWAFLLPHWTVRLEYLHVEFDNVTTNYNTTITVNAVNQTASTSVTSNNGINIVRAGVSYLFNL